MLLFGELPIYSTYNGQRLNTGTNISSNDKQLDQSDGENDDYVPRQDQSDIPQSRRELIEDFNKSIAVRELSGRPSYAISTKPAR